MPELISKNPTYNDFKLYYGLESTPGSQISLSDPHFSQIDKNGSYLTKNGVTLTEKDILDKWYNWRKIGPQGTINYGKPIELGEVVVTPNVQQLQKIRLVFPDEVVRKSMLRYLSNHTPSNISSSDVVDRFMEAYNLGGNPSVGFNPFIERSMAPITIFPDKNSDIIPDIYILYNLGMKNNLRYPDPAIGAKIMTELGHAQGNIKDASGKTLNDQMSISINKGYFPDSSVGDSDTAYDFVGSQEFIAHYIFEPLNKAFVTRRTPKFFLDQLAKDNKAVREFINSPVYKNNEHIFNNPINSVNDLRNYFEKLTKEAVLYGDKVLLDYHNKNDNVILKTAREVTKNFKKPFIRF